MLLALKIDVDTLRGTREGVPTLVTLLRKHGADATFLFSLGPDHTGRAIKRVFRRGFVGKVRRTSVVRHYGVKTLCYGTLLPGTDIGRRAADVMRATRDAGFEVGIHCWDHVRWQDGVAAADAEWTRAEMQRACDRFTDIFAADPLSTVRQAGNERRAPPDPAPGVRYCPTARACAASACVQGRADPVRSCRLPCPRWMS
jgi:peptidoglycan/xylan/chitin deacetylase (PgdA/CDA1 family)